MSILPMRHFYLTSTLMLFILGIQAQQDHIVNPFIQEFGGIYPLHEAVVKPDPDLRYKIVIDVVSGNDVPNQINGALNNVARLMNLHVIGGVPQDSLDIVLAVHGKATSAILEREAYEATFGCQNPNLPLVDALIAAGVTITVCGQSLKHEGILPHQVHSKVAIATSMLTTVTMHQQMGYHLLRF